MRFFIKTLQKTISNSKLIFDTADYGIVGDLFESVPAMIEEIKKAKA